MGLGGCISQYIPPLGSVRIQYYKKIRVFRTAEEMIASWRGQEDEPHQHIWKQQELELQQQQSYSYPKQEEQTHKIWHGERIEEQIGERIGERRRRVSEPNIHR